ncbi:efflux RND transporter permease subunit [Candidatus Dojkabacteria bacterium]|uniref:Efflux RND transporter permease subunit n=1 Tax=Candidatus Dojkabacteria bacterium TaxID=2099670 RepID=A0A955I9X6_9BACT|nr:efflux RND transporter permease subunit [Candidatus Dojkabacteria bacterium]
MEKKGFITKISSGSVKRFRTTIIAFLLILIFGAITYTSLLPREGFPALEFPTIFVQTIYPVGDKAKVEEDITKPVAQLAQDIENVESVSSVSADSFSFITISYKTGTNVSDAEKELNNLIDANLAVPDQVNLNVIALKPNTIDGENELLLAVTSNAKDLEQLQSDAKKVSDELTTLSEVKQSQVIKAYDNVFNPITGITSETQITFNRYGEKKNSDIKINNSVLIGLQKNDDISAVKFSEAINKKIEDITDSKEINNAQIVTVYDEAVGLNQQIASLESNAVSALFIVALTLFLFVSWRASIVAVLFIPTVMAASFITMLLLGVSLNVISLFALILVLGLLVDDAIVIVESIDYHKRQGRKGIQAVEAALENVGKADLVGTVTTILVFFPMLFIIGFLGDIIKDVPITVIITLFWSLTIAITIVPLLSNVLIPSNHKKTPIYWILNSTNEMFLFYGKVTSLFVQLYVKRWYLSLVVIIISIGFVGFGGFLASTLQFVDFPPQKDSNSVSVNISFLPNTPLDEQEAIVKQTENIVLSEYKDVVEKVTYPQLGRNFNGGESAMAIYELTPMSERSVTSIKIANSLEDEIKAIKTAEVSIAADQMGGPPSAEFQSQIQLYGSDITVLNNAAEKISDYIQTIKFPTDVKVIESRIGNSERIAKLNGSRYISIETKLECEVDDASIRFVADEVKNEFDENKLKDLGLQSDALGDDRGFATEIFESVISAGVALLGSFIIIYIFLVIVFNSFTQALLIMLAIPFSFVGLFGGLSLTDNPISFFVIIGMIALVGIVVNNTVMLLDFANQHTQLGYTPADAIVEAVKLRFRPLLTTSATTILGLIPLALSEPLWESLAVAIIFGLMSSTFLVVLSFPAYYVLVENLKLNIKKIYFKIFK